MLVILAPAVLDSPVSSSAESAFWTRLWLIVLVGVWGTAMVAAFDAFWKEDGRQATQAKPRIS
jgi:hypothetical protein